MTKISLEPLMPILDKLAPKGRTALLPALQAAQKIYGYVPEQAAVAIANRLHVPLADVHGVLEFYALLYRTPVGKTVIHICADPVCAMAGADTMLKQTSRKFEFHGKHKDKTPTVTIERSPCLGLCEHAPALLVQSTPLVQPESYTWEDLIAGKGKKPRSIIGGDISILTANCRKGQIVWLEDYKAQGGYQALNKVLQMAPQEVIEEVKASGLVGRGGAAFPTGLKWESAAQSTAQPKYVVCNADEAEPGTFKDRVLMENDPHLILEGILIAAYAIGATYGYMYIRGEYEYQYQVMSQAVDEAKKDGLIGNNILQSDFSFELELRQGAGAYICGEETALFESIEGKRGFPRVKPPFPTTAGLFGKPTVINNVETLANVPFIIQKGATEYRKIGTEKSPGPKLFCVSGDVAKPGLYEVPFGVTFRHLLFDLAGGIRNNRTMKAALFGGAAGAFATESDLDVRLTFEDLRVAGLPLGSGVITVFDETRDMRDVLLRLAHFFAEESCGKCYPCQIGTQRQYEILQRLATSSLLPGDLERLQDVGWTMTEASLCGLGQTAASAVLSAIRLWPELFKSHQAH